MLWKEIERNRLNQINKGKESQHFQMAELKRKKFAIVDRISETKKDADQLFL